MIDASRSRAAFLARFPEIMEEVERPDAVTSSLVVENGAVIDAIVNGQRLYGGDVRDFTAAQVASFMAKPLRLFMERPSTAGLISPICVKLHDALGNQLLDDGMEEISRQVVDSPSFLVVFGLGLGHHLDELVCRTKAKWLILVEPMVDFIAHSFQTVDWADLLGRVEKDGGSVHVITETDPAKMVSAIVRFMSAKGIPYVDGSHVFTHYPFWAFAEGRARLYEAVEFAFINRGFFEDEIIMMSNAVANFAAGPFWLIEGRPRLHRKELAVVVGAGPSLDEGLPYLKEIRDQVVIFSGGTALRALLRAGIVPDFQCELENVPAAFDAVSEAGKSGDLKAITLLASATVDPRMPPLFGETVYFFRDSVSSTQILGEKHLPIAGATPTCVNMALSMAAFLGFTDIALFGADCGMRPGGLDHAADTVYNDIGLFKRNDDIAQRFPLEVEGNFGGIARTNWIYDSCRLMLIEVINRRCLNAVNCSDGAFIPGAVPRVPEALEVTYPVVDRAALFDDLKRSLNRIEPADLFAESDLADVAEQADRLLSDLDEKLDRLAHEGTDFARVYGEVVDFLETAGEHYRHTDSIVTGTLHALPRIAMFFGFRVGDKAIKNKLFSLFIKEFKLIIKEMREETAALFATLAPLTAKAGSGEKGQDRRRLLGRGRGA